MKYTCTLIAVRNMENAKQFYHDVLGLDVISDFGANADRWLSIAEIGFMERLYS